jgi:hypothetical protein
LFSGTGEPVLHKRKMLFVSGQSPCPSVSRIYRNLPPLWKWNPPWYLRWFSLLWGLWLTAGWTSL